MKLPRFIVLAWAATIAAIVSIPVVHAAPKRPLINGDFDKPAVGQPPANWTPAYPTGSALIVKEGNDTFLRLKPENAANAGVLQKVEVPADARKVLVLGRMRGKPENKKEPRAAVQVCLTYKDDKGANISAAILSSEDSPNWHTYKREFDLPASCKDIEVSARSIFAEGTFDFDEVRLEFK